MAQIPYHWKNCATCAYWGGSRTSNRFGEWAEVSSTMDKGMCMCNDNGWFRQDKQASASCLKHKKWPVLK